MLRAYWEYIYIYIYIYIYNIIKNNIYIDGEYHLLPGGKSSPKM